MVRTALKEALASLTPEEALSDQKRQTVIRAISLVAKASKKGLIHPNASRRKISKLMVSMNQLERINPSSPSS